MIFSPSSTLQTLDSQLEQFFQLLPHSDARAAVISKWSVGEHLEHTIEITDYVTRTLLERPVRTNAKKPLTFRGRALLVLGVIPRGAADSPPQFLPKGKSSAEINQQLMSVQARIHDVMVNPRSVDSFTPFAHPVLGVLRGRQWLRFLCIHQQHHLKIIKEILPKVSPTAPLTTKSK